MKLPKNFPIVKHDAADHVLSLPEEIHAEIHRASEVKPLAQVGRRIEAPFKGSSHKVGSDDRIVAQITPQLTLIARYVRAARQRDRTLLESVDIPFASTLLVALLALGLFFLMVSITPRSDDSFSDDLSRNQQRFTKYQVKPPEKTEQPKFKDLSGAKEGEKSRGEEGKVGKEEAKKKEADPSKKGTPEVDPNKKEKDLAKIKKHMNEIKYCYEKELSKDPGLYGKITVLFMIEGTGRVGEALVQQTTMGSEPVESCIINHVRRWMFPSPQGGGTVQVTYPYVFKPSGQ